MIFLAPTVSALGFIALGGFAWTLAAGCFATSIALLTSEASG